MVPQILFLKFKLSYKPTHCTVLWSLSW